MKLALGENPADLILRDIEEETGVTERKGNIMAEILPQHYNFYARAMWNSLIPNFYERYDYITENEVSGELLEALRLIQETVAPDIQEGEAAEIKYADMDEIFDLTNILRRSDFTSTGIGDEIKLALGNFMFMKQDGKIRVVDAYDFDRSGEVDTVGQTLGTIRKKDNVVYYAARYLGEKRFPAKTPAFGFQQSPDYSSLADTDYTQIRITLPDEPMHENIDFDDYAEQETSDYVFRGPMTNKRKRAFDEYRARVLNKKIIEGKSGKAKQVASEQTMEAPPMKPRMPE